MKKIILPNINQKTLAESLIEYEFAKDELISNYRFHNERLLYDDFSNVELSKCLFTSCQIIETNVSVSSFVDCMFQSCDFSNSNFSRAIFHRCHFIDCKFAGTDFSKSYMRNILFEQCLLNDSNWNEGDLLHVQYVDSNLRNASISNCKWQVEFNRCDLSYVYLPGTSMNQIDLSTCDLHGIILDINLLKGCIVSEIQAIEIARLFGLVIKK